MLCRAVHCCFCLHGHVFPLHMPIANLDQQRPCLSVCLSPTVYLPIPVLQAVEEWYARYHQLRHFKQLHHHTRVPEEDDPAFEGWAGWVRQQECELAAGRLSRTQSKLLRGLLLV